MTMININHYREANANPINPIDPWQDALFSSSSQIADLRYHDLITFGRQPLLQQHNITYLTGKETCHAHHFAKMFATAILRRQYPDAPSITVNNVDMGVSDAPSYASTAPAPTVLWIDTVHGPHACADIFREMTSGIDSSDSLFHLLCLDVLGQARDNFWEITRRIEFLIQDIKPTLVIIDDIDHLMPYSGITVAQQFNNVIRDTINHTETAFLLIGYNHLNKRASTTGNVGRMLFSGADHIFSVTTNQTITQVRLVKSRDLRSIHRYQHDFHFSIGPDNLPIEVLKTMPSELSPSSRNYVEHNTLRDIMTQVIPPDQGISPDQLTSLVAARRARLNRIDQTRTLIAQARRLGLITLDTTTNLYHIAPPRPSSASHRLVSSRPAAASPLPTAPASEYCEAPPRSLQPQHPASQQDNNNPHPDFNTSLTLPPHQPATSPSMYCETPPRSQQRGSGCATRG